MRTAIALILLVSVSIATGATFTVTNTNATGPGSLQQAILDANAAAGLDFVAFAIPGDGPHVISPTSAQPLPFLTNHTVIDGYTQPGASPNTLTNGFNAVIKIHVDGAGAGSFADGFTIVGTNNIVRGLAITRFGTGAGDGISINGDYNVIEGNLIGLHPTNSPADYGNARNGITVSSGNNRIGGATPAARNVISDNSQYGVYIQNASRATNNMVQGNVIGLAVNGNRDGNNSGGIILLGVRHNSFQGNVISGNTGSGILLQFGATNNFIQGNVIGADYTGTLSRSNTVNGIWLIDAPGNIIGGNVIALNGRHGVQLDGTARSNQIIGNTIISNITSGVFVGDGTNNNIAGNSIVGNRSWGIDLAPSGVNPNDLQDLDGGANLGQNRPMLTNATVTRTNLTIRGRLESAPNTAYQVQFFANVNCDITGFGEGEFFLGAASVTTDGAGNANFTETLALPNSLPGLSLTATATDPFGNTSEFSPCLDLAPFIPSMTFTVINTNDSGPGSLRQALLDVNAQYGADRIEFNIPGPGVHTIFPLSSLPAPLDPMFIDGYTQPGTIPNTSTNGNNASLMIRLDGRNAGAPSVNGLYFNTSSNTVRGLIIVRFSGDGIHLAAGRGNRVEDVWIGVDTHPAPAAFGGTAPGLFLGGNGECGFECASGVQDFIIIAAVLSGNDAEGLCTHDCEGGEVINTEAMDNGGTGFVIDGNNVTISYSYGGYSLHGFEITGDDNTVRFSASGSTVSHGWSVMGNNNRFQTSAAWDSMGDGWNIMGFGNLLQNCGAFDIGDDAVSVESGTGNRFDFAEVYGIFDDLIDDPVRDDLSNLSAGYSSMTATRLKGTISGEALPGTYTVSVMVNYGSDAYPDLFERVAAFNVSKSSFNPTNPTSFNQVIHVDPPIGMGDEVLAYVTGPGGSSQAMITMAVPDMMPDVRSTIMPFSPSPVRVGDTVQATVQVSNEQFGPASDVWGTVSSTFARIVDITPPEGGTVTGPVNGTYTVGLGALSIGGTISYSVKMVPPNSGSFFLTVNTMLVGETDANPANNVDGRSGTVSSGTNSQNNATVADTTSGGDTLHPISTFTGELFESLAPDLDLGGPMRLAFSRYYASFLHRLGRSGTLGHNWRHMHEWSLTDHGATVDILTDRGRVITFTNSAGTYTLIGRRDIAFQLYTSAGNFVFADPQMQRLYTFNSAGKLTSIDDTRGNVHTLAYTGGNLTSVSDGLGRTLTFQYSSAGFLTNVSDGFRSVAFAQIASNLTTASSPLGFVTTYAYDPTNAFSGLLTSATMPEGNVPYAQTFDAVGRVATQTVAPTNTHRLTYATNAVTIADPLGRTRRDIHSPRGELLAFIDEANQMMAMDYNTNGQRIAVADRLANITRLAYHTPSGYVSAITNTDGTVTSFAYTNRNAGGATFFDLAQVTHPDGTTERFIYDTNGNVLARTDRAGKIFNFTYNARGQVLTAENPLGGITTYTYHPNGTLASRDDTDTGELRFYYDAFGRLTDVLHPDGTGISVLHDIDDRLYRLTDERTNTYTFLYDNNGNLTHVIDPLSHTNQFAYDTRDRLSQAIDRLGRATAIAYDPLEHVSALTNRNGHVTDFGYDTRRRLATVTDAGNQTWNFGFDNEALLTGFANPLGQTNRIRRDTLGYEIGFVNALTQTNAVQRDSLHRITHAIDPLSRTNRFSYDERGLLTNSAAPVVGSAGYQRNDLGLLTRVIDLNGSQWNFAYTPMGRVASIADPLNRTNRFTYDDRGRPSLLTFADGITCSNVYDTAGNVIRRLYSDGTELQYAFDQRNQLLSANGFTLAYDAERRLTNTTMAGVNFGAAYDAGGRLTNITYNAGAAFAVTYTYDSRNRLVSVSDSLTGTQLDFAYDNAGRLTGLNRPNGVNGTYTYDAAGRLTRIQEGTIIDLDYTLDAAAQITNLNYTLPLDPTNGFGNSTANWTYDAAHQIDSPGYHYDARGRLTNTPDHSFRYDGASRLTRINAIELRYNGAHDLVTRIEGGAATRYLYNYALGMRPIVAEKNDTTGQLLRYYIWSPGGALLYMIDVANGNAVRHFHFDRVGSTLALTDSTGAVTDSYAYTPYGELLGRTGASQQPFLYVGRFGVRAEPAAGLYHMRARYYDPVTARFLSRDPVWPLLAQPLTLQPYQYAINNPVKYIDPSGREVEIDGTMIVGAFLFRPDQSDASRRSSWGSWSLSPPVPEPEPLEDILADLGPEGAYAAMMAAMTSQGDDYVPPRFRSASQPWKVTAKLPLTIGAKPRKAVAESVAPIGSMLFSGGISAVNSDTGVPMSARPAVVVTSRTGEVVVPAPGLEDFLRDAAEEILLEMYPFPFPWFGPLDLPTPGGGMQRLDPSPVPEPVESILDEIEEVLVPS